jgi:catechol 2,3-dioxygenase-like lactoylglutathione lyase family enzyme
VTAPGTVLDHVGVVVPDLESARAAYAGLGFALTPRSSHKGRLTPGGPVELWGSGNHCAMFENGYLEIIGVTDPHRHHENVRRRLQRYFGLHLIAIGCSDAPALHDRLAGCAEGIQQMIEVGREVPYGSGTKPALFRIVHVEDEAFDEAELFFIEHATPQVLWQTGLLAQPNGVMALAGATICSANMAQTAHRLARYLGTDPSTVDGHPLFELGRGWIEVATPGQLAERYPGERLPAVPCVASATFTVRALAQTRDALRSSGSSFESAENRVWIRREHAVGAILEFAPA